LPVDFKFHVCAESSDAEVGHQACAVASQCGFFDSAVYQGSETCAVGDVSNVKSSSLTFVSDDACGEFQVASTYVGTMKKTDSNDSTGVLVTISSRNAGQLLGRVETNPFHTNLCGTDQNLPAGFLEGTLEEDSGSGSAAGEFHVNANGVGVAARVHLTPNTQDGHPCVDASVEIDPDPFFCGTSYVSGRLCVESKCANDMTRLDGDFNGDGRADSILWRNDTKSWDVHLATGDGFRTETWFGAWGSDGPIHVGDFNGDGKSDIIMWRDVNKDWTVNLSTGTGFDWRAWNGAWGSDGPINVGDFNGDGYDDIATWSADGDAWLNLSTGSGFSTRP
jgi:hypothetical protein